MIPQENRFQAITNKADYYTLVASGMAWELFPDLEHTWEEFILAKLRWRIAKLREFRKTFNFGDYNGQTSEN